MLIQASTPRPVFDTSKHPEYIHIHTLRKVGVSTGEVFFIATVDPEHGTKDGKALDPVNEYPIEGQDGLVALEYVLPFWELFQRTKSMLEAKYNGSNALAQGIRVGSVAHARYFSNGFQVTIKSAFRADSRTYAENRVAFTIQSAVTGGGVLRLADSAYDIANPTFDPWAPGPTVPKDLELQESYNRTHRALPAGADAKRAARIAEAEANMRRNEGREEKPKLLEARNEEPPLEIVLEEPKGRKPKDLLEQAKKLLGGG